MKDEYQNDITRRKNNKRQNKQKNGHQMVEKAFNVFNHSKLMTDQEDKAWRLKNLKQINLEYDPRLQY